MHQNIVILTGAGISAESGLQTFRSSDGLWCGHRIEEVATPEGFAHDPDKVQDFYNMRRRQLKDVKPNAAHHALAKLAETWKGTVTLITQNVDDLHQRAGIENMNFFAMHGELKKVRCLNTHQTYDWVGDIDPETECECCKQTDTLRPHIVWFGEMPFFMDDIEKALEECDLFLSIGTSGNVYPAAGFVQQLRMIGRAHTVELNLEPSLGSHTFHEAIHGPATSAVPEYVERLLESA